MGALFSYSICSSLLLASMYLIYKWMLAGENQHRYNRAILWAIYIVALAAPALNTDGLFAMQHGPMPQNTDTLIEAGTPQLLFTVETAAPLWPRVLLALWLAGAVLVLLYTAMVAVRLARAISGGEKQRIGRNILVITGNNRIAPFSWMRYIVMSRSDYTCSGEVILTHETRHLEARHWIDLLFAQLVAVFQWYNPAAWLMREELKSVHEYQADEAVIASGADPRQYQMLLIKKAVGARFPSLANSLNHSKLKKRVTMMYQKPSSKARRMRALALVPAGALALFVTAIPSVASMLSDTSDAELAFAAGKVKENAAEQQEAASAPKHISVYADSAPAGTEADNGGYTAGKVISVAFTPTGENAEATGSPAVYVNGQKMNTQDLNSINPSDITSITINKQENQPDGVVYVTLADNGKTEKGTRAEAGKEASGKPAAQKAVEQMPQFIGGETAMMSWLAKNLRYPETATKAHTEGRVVVQFVVTASGKVADAKVLRSVSPELDAEALRVVGDMPAWTPGTIDGKPVDCHYVIPISFKLSSDNAE